MIVGVLKEIKAEEKRVAITPAGVEIMVQQEHQVILESGAGEASGFDDSQYEMVGAQIVSFTDDIFNRSEMILRVKEPQPSEYNLLQKGQIYFSYLHLAASEKITNIMLKSDVVGIGYETIQTSNRSLPLLKPMSEVAGPMAIQEGDKYLEMTQGGNGMLIGGVPGVNPASVLILGGGVVGLNAAKMACGLGASVYVLEVDLDKQRYLSDVMPPNCFILMSNPATVRDLVKKADIVVGAVLVPGSRTPTLISREMLATIKKGAVMIDVAIDQGGCFETSRETTHADPIYVVDDIVHYSVSNMPGAVPRTSTLALTNATLPYALEIAGKGWRRAVLENSEIKHGVNVIKGKVTHKAIAETFGLEYAPIETLL
jgi:alanine dehydrogenase